MGGALQFLAKPATFMTRPRCSGAKSVRFFQIPLGHVVVFHDELDLAPAKLRVKTGGGNAGHNGLRSITAHVGNDYRRVRMGVVMAVRVVAVVPVVLQVLRRPAGGAVER